MNRRNFFRNAVATIAALFIAKPAVGRTIKTHSPVGLREMHTVHREGTLDLLPPVPTGFFRSIIHITVHSVLNEDGTYSTVRNFSCVDCEQPGGVRDAELSQIIGTLTKPRYGTYDSVPYQYVGKCTEANTSSDGLIFVLWGGTVTYGKS